MKYRVVLREIGVGSNVWNCSTKKKAQALAIAELRIVWQRQNFYKWVGSVTKSDSAKLVHPEVGNTIAQVRIIKGLK